MSAYLAYSQRFEDLYQIYNGPKKSKGNIPKTEK